MFFLVFVVVAGFWLFGEISGSDESPPAASNEPVAESVESVPGEVPSEAAPAEQTQYCVIGSPAARMRTGPGSDYEQVARLLQGTCEIYDAGEENGYGGPVTQSGVADTGETVDWRLVRHGAETGWIVDSFLR